MSANMHNQVSIRFSFVEANGAHILRDGFAMDTHFVSFQIAIGNCSIKAVMTVELLLIVYQHLHKKSNFYVVTKSSRVILHDYNGFACVRSGRSSEGNETECLHHVYACVAKNFLDALQQKTDIQTKKML